ncbi:MAG TPA: methyltransferase [Gemmatimonadales bacterium]|nr:methyltransferase [Gemmatimonadales bacterium]
MGVACRVVGKWAFAAVVAAILILLFTGNLLSRSPVVIVLQVAALAVAAWARRSFPPATFSVTAEPRGGAVIEKGPYRWVRHPQYSAVLILIWAGVLSHLSALSLAVGVVVAVVASLRIVCEERQLVETLPGYADYARRTRRLIPFVI